ncbi:transposase [Terasakiella sp. A23]|uniref:IS110 family transposase n=1 Tax=Terasakiella sp. FCG-A23 TaxID=3080561 RepID=UPI002954D8A7|nr:transposase [Terasakiella sp. A23]MDV7341711.1 transposase [Terasakiella sp. A23]
MTEAVYGAQDCNIGKKAQHFRPLRLSRTADGAFTLEYKDDEAMTQNTRFVGIDISKSKLDVCILPDRIYLTYENTVSGIEDCLRTLQIRQPIERIILEATGGYEKRILKQLQQAESPVCRINALQVRHFAKASGLLAKTDKIDAFVLADYGMRMPCDITPELSETQQRLIDLVARYRQLKGMIAQEKIA